MSAIPKKKFTVEEYIEFDNSTEGRFEFFDGEVFEVSGAHPNHALLESKLGFLIQSKIDRSKCFVFASTLRLVVPKLPPFRYADLTALCGKPEYQTIGGLPCLTNPSLIIEILSPSTEKFDQTEKLVGYKSIPSFNEYLLVSQNQKLIIQYTKHNGRFWLQTEYGDGETLRLKSLGVELSVDEIYQGII